MFKTPSYFIKTIVSCLLFASSSLLAAPGDPYINEVDADTNGIDVLEFIELFGLPNTVLDGFVVVFYNGSDDASYEAFDLDGFSLDANGFFVLGNSAVANVDLVFTNDSLHNGADAVALFQADATDFPNDTPLTTVNLIDAMVYDTDDSDDAGLLPLLNLGQPQVNERAGGDSQGHSNQRCPDGGEYRDTDTYIASTPTPGASNCPILSATTYINEVDADTNGIDALEFIELFGASNATLDGLVVVFYNGSDDASYAAFDLDGFSLDANGFFVLGNSAVANVDLVFANDSLQNGADGVALYQADAADFPNDTPLTTVNLIDALVYDTDDGDDAGLLPLLNVGQPQVNERNGGIGDAHSNQRCPDGGVFRDTDTYIAATPTPSSVNNCPSVPSFRKLFVPDVTFVSNAVTLTFTIDNSLSSVAATALDFTDNLPAGMVIANPSSATSDCSGGTLTASTATGVISYSGGTVAMNASCTISVDVSAGSAGVYNNVSGDLTSSSGDSGSALDALLVDPMLGFSASFDPTTVTVDSVSTLRFLFDNSGSSQAVNGISFAHIMPGTLVVGSTPNINFTCTGGTVIANSGTNQISLSGASVNANSSCLLEVDVSSNSTGTFMNTTGDLISSSGNTGSEQASLVVELLAIVDPQAVPIFNQWGLFLLLLALGWIGITRFNLE